MRNLMKLGFLFLMVLILGMIISAQQWPRVLKIGKPTAKLSISPLEPTTQDMITFTVNAQDNSGTGLKEITILVNDRKEKVCLMSPCIFFGGPYPEGPLSYGAEVYDNTDNEPWTDFRAIYVKDASRIEPLRKRAARLPGEIIDLMPLAENENTQWANGYDTLPFPGQIDDFRGFARYEYDSLLEDDQVYPRVLLTHPEVRNEYGLIVGIFEIEKLPEKATFRARVGFLKRANQTDGVEFRVFVKKDPSYYAAQRCYYDGRLDDLALDLDRYAGQQVEIVLQVRVLYTSTQDLAVWVDPRIE